MNRSFPPASIVVGADDPSLVPEFTGPRADVVLHHTNCSVMSVRGCQRR
jgi:nucleotide-binding universal stress UspA family protein